MALKTGNINDMLDFCQGKKLVCYGAGDKFERLCRVFAAFNLRERIDFLADKDTIGQIYENHTIVILFSGMEKLKEFLSLFDIGLFKDADFYIGEFLLHNPPSYTLPEHNPEDKPLIPKTIHYCWFGGNPHPPLIKKCMESWKKFCPDYEIIEWSEDNFDIRQNRFISEAYQAKKWAFVSDYVRLDVIYRYGGIYMDTDVELLKPLDRFLYDSAFCGMEFISAPVLSIPFGAVPGNGLVRALRDMFNNMSFIKADGSFDMTPSTIYHTLLFRQLGLTDENKLQKTGGFTVYPTDVFAPLQPTLIVEGFTERSHAIHHYAWSWGSEAEINEKQLYVRTAREMLAQLHGGDLYHIHIHIG